MRENVDKEDRYEVNRKSQGVKKPWLLSNS